MKLDLSGLGARERELFDRRVAELRTQARPGERVALVCDHKECVPPFRMFGDPDWKCPEHGRAVVQENRPYMGVPTV